ncbi:MAG: hypothetical protein LLG04_01865 [Parachlamydia sp.]|nr:hypothetical protein [Parachlamydia sp.]
MKQVADLFGKHTKETGQIFEKVAIEHAFYLTQGQPWLINALVNEAVSVEVKDRSQPITKEATERAKNCFRAQSQTW